MFQLPDIINGAIQVIFRGRGCQEIGVYLNFVAYYIVGIPLGVLKISIDSCIIIHMLCRGSTILSGEWSGTNISQQYNIVKAEYWFTIYCESTKLIYNRL